MKNLLQRYIENDTSTRFALMQAHFPALEGKDFEAFAHVVIREGIEDSELNGEVFSQILDVFAPHPLKLIRFAD